MSMQNPKGTRDFFPEDQRIQNYIFDTWRETCLRFGYEEYEGPTFEHLELYTEKSGDEIVRQLYNFQDKGGRDLALRPELTPTLARMVAGRIQNLRKPCKWFAIPRLFRYERAQKGRLREFYQLNMDIIASPGIHAEADLLVAISTMLRSFGLTEKDFVIGVSSRRLLAEFLMELGITNPDAVYPMLDRRLKVSPEQFTTSLTECGLNPEQATRLNAFMSSPDLPSLGTHIHSTAAHDALAELHSLFSLLQGLGLEQDITLDLSVVRGLAYYTGVVFEVFDRSKSMRAIAGGGRYDNLCARLGGKDVTGVGFGMGDVVLADLLRDRGLMPSDFGGPHYFLISTAGSMPALFASAKRLRQFGYRVSHALDNIKVGKQMEMAFKSGARQALFVDSDRCSPAQCEIKTLSTGQQEICLWSEILTSGKK